MIAVTGSNGFVGKYIVQALLANGHSVLSIARSKTRIKAKALFELKVDTLDAHTRFDFQNNTPTTVIHCAAIPGPIADNRKLYEVNVAATLNLARQAVAAGVKKFIFISSVKVHGEVSNIDKPFTSLSDYNPQTNYADSKMQAELGLKEISQETGLQIVIIRLPLVYGKGNKGNFAALQRIIQKGSPLPFANFSNNRRSLLYIKNLTDFILFSLQNTDMINRQWLISDDLSVSTAKLLLLCANAAKRKLRLFSLPISFWRFIFKFKNGKKLQDSLFSSLEVDNSIIKKELGWQPKYSLMDGLKETLEVNNE